MYKILFSNRKLPTNQSVRPNLSLNKTYFTTHHVALTPNNKWSAYSYGKLFSTSKTLSNQAITSDPFKNLFQYIRNNKIIPNKLAALQAESEQAQPFLLDLKKGHYDSIAFANPHCATHILHLMETKKIPFAEGLTVYSYLTALRQFTDLQDLKPEDHDVKSLRTVTVDVLSKDGVLTEAGKFYVHKLCERFKGTPMSLDERALTDFVLTLPPIEQWLIKVPHDTSSIITNHVNRMTAILMNNVPFFVPDNALTFQAKYYYVPSTSVINYVLKQITDKPLEMFPVFGVVGRETLRALHEMDKHPVSLYDVDVTRNPRDADKYRCGPFLIWLHDLGHLFWGSLLSAKGRELIKSQFAPQIEAMMADAKLAKDDEVYARLHEVLERGFDFDLTPLPKFYDPNTRLIEYLLRTFSSNLKNHLYDDDKAHYAYLGKVEDRILFLMAKKYYQLKQNRDEAKDLWKMIYKKTRSAASNYRFSLVIDTIVAQAKQAAGYRRKASLFERVSSTSPLSTQEKITALEDGLANLQTKNAADAFIALTENRHHFAYIMSLTEVVWFGAYNPLSNSDKQKLMLSMQKELDQLLSTRLEVTPTARLD